MARVLKALARSVTAFMAGGCLLCDQPCALGDLPGLCALCRDALPFNHVPCKRCAAPLEGQTGVPAADRLCTRCRTVPPPFTRALAPLLYEGHPRNWVRQFKSRFGLVEGRLLGELLWLAALRAVADRDFPSPDMVLPVPLARLRQAARGHNQALSLAIPVARHVGAPLARHAVRRIRGTPSQRSLGRAARLANLTNAFASRPWHGECVAIVDDVMTTGTTAAALASTLLGAGAGEVVVLCATRTPAAVR